MRNGPVRFLCDEMLKGLGKWLRIAGYDVLILPDGSDDQQLLEQALTENRLLLTRDRKIAEHKKAKGTVVLLDCQELAECAGELGARFAIDWLFRPFSRCMICNTLLIEANKEQWQEIPNVARQSITLLRFCPTCNQLFWDGSHVARMRERLQQWATQAKPIPTTEKQTT